MDMDEIIKRLQQYCLNNPDLVKSGIIKGLDPSGKVVVQKDGNLLYLSIDELESNSWRNSNTTVEKEQEELVEVLDEQPQEFIIQNLNDMYNAILAKNENAINKALSTFAVDQTGSININSAIKTMTDNSMNNVINSIKNNTILPSDFSMYDIKGNLIVSPNQLQGDQNLQNLIDTSFRNILIYVEAAKLRNVVFSEEQISAAKTKYETNIKDKMNVLGLNNSSQKQSAQVLELKPTNEISPDKDIKKAGFADILILTIIVLIYAAIIINLVSKLK